MTYLIDNPELASAVASAKPHPKHTHLLAAIRRVPGLEAAKLTAAGDQGRLCCRKVISANGQVISDDHQAWLRDECGRSGAGTAWRYLKSQGHRLSACNVNNLYVTVDRGGVRQDNYLQIEIELQDERLERRLFDEDYSWSAPRDDRELIELAVQGPRLPDDQCTALGPPVYRLGRTVDVAIFIQLAEQTYNENNTRNGAKMVKVTFDSGESTTGTIADLFPEAKPGPWKGRRLFEDWAFSSAGRSGARLCDHWALRMDDWTNPHTQERDMAIIPIWGFTGKLAEVKSASLSDYALYGKLEAMDRRLGVPFGWYAYMLHGNRVHDWAGERILRAAEAGKIVLPEHDYQVLKAWHARPYGF